MLVPFREAFGNDLVKTFEHSSNIGFASLIKVPFTTKSVPDSFKLSGDAPNVCPEMRFMSPGVDEPNVDPKKLSLNAKY